MNYEVSFNWDNLDDLTAGLTLFNSEFKDKITEIRTCQSDSGTRGCDWLGKSLTLLACEKMLIKPICVVRKQRLAGKFYPM